MIGMAFHTLLARLNLLSSLGILLLIGLISADVFGRAFFHMPIPGVPEVVRFSVVCMFWLQMAYVLRTGGHLRTTLVFDVLPQRVQQVVMLLNALAGSIIMALIVHYGLPELLKSWEINEFEGALPVRIPVWPIWTIIIFCAALTALQYAVDFIAVLCGEELADSSADNAEATI